MARFFMSIIFVMLSSITYTQEDNVYRYVTSVEDPQKWDSDVWYGIGEHIFDINSDTTSIMYSDGGDFEIPLVLVGGLKHGTEIRNGKLYSITYGIYYYYFEESTFIIEFLPDGYIIVFGKMNGFDKQTPITLVYAKKI